MGKYIIEYIELYINYLKYTFPNQLITCFLFEVNDNKHIDIQNIRNIYCGFAR